MNAIQQEDILAFSLPEELISDLRDSRIILTGATGLIGSAFIRCLSALNIGVSFILPVRDSRKAAEMFADLPVRDSIIECQLTDFFSFTELKADFIVHCASPTNGQYMSAHPAETFLLITDSTKAILNYARANAVKALLFLSSIEYYGQIFNNRPVSEDMTGAIDHSSPRSSYSLGKQAAEFLAFAYAQEYGVPVKTARLTQTFGAGIAPSDNRVFAQFARSAVSGTDIILHTPGRSAKPYCYLTDCVSALAFILLKGAAGQAYNVATPGSYVTIRELAEMFCRQAPSKINIRQADADLGYAPETQVNLDPSKLLSLGWSPRFSLPQMIERLIKSIS